MNKKILALILALLVVLALIIIFIDNDPSTTETPLNQDVNEKTVEVTDINQITKIKENSYLNTLLQIKTFDTLNVSHESLLEVAMRLAGILNLYETENDDMYTTFVPKSTIHELIFELSGIRIDNPIIIDDFYYLYNSEKDYYYIVPSGSEWIDLTNLTSIFYSATLDQYIVKCSAESINDYGIKTIYPEIEIRLKYKASNNYLKYQLISIDAGKSQVEFIEPESYELENY